MNFRNVNPLNVYSNYISGNLLPLAPHSSRFSITWKSYGGFMWLLQGVQLCVLIPGLIMVSWEKAIIDGTITAILTIEVFFIVGQIQTHKKLVDRLIRKLNDILQIEDEIMKDVVMTTIKPMDGPLRFYLVSGALSVFVWFSLPLLMVFERETFFYEDFRLPAVFSQQPFSSRTFVLGSILVLFGNVQIFLKKCGLDIYMIHLVLMLTAQYRYTARRLALIFQDADKRCKFGEVSCEADQWMDNAIKALCRHHTTVIRLSVILRKLLSSSLSMIYVNSVLRFSFTAILFNTVLSATPLEGLLVSMYSCGSVMEFYMLCSCVQQLQDASTNITDEAFHEKWYQFGPSVKRTFMLMVLGNTLGCKLSTCDKFNLSLPSFMAILNQSYSIALVLL
ncbi:odorant receptor 67a-like [Odontomachus brunneus]|uniref:odorant receptor 67a-like n=1 Tax=Odontomachus brunneus TaxID=486640 RepID=UPI0013F20FD7|nr:odorant receptor 67a-like [Odontomachus brunneus]